MRALVNVLILLMLFFFALPFAVIEFNFYNDLVRGQGIVRMKKDSFLHWTTLLTGEKLTPITYSENCGIKQMVGKPIKFLAVIQRGDEK